MQKLYLVLILLLSLWGCTQLIVCIFYSNFVIFLDKYGGKKKWWYINLNDPLISVVYPDHVRGTVLCSL